MSGSQRPLQNRVTPFGDVIARRLAMFWGLSPPYPSSGEAMVVLRGTESLLTHRWREMDSNQWYGGTEKLPSAAPVSGPTLAEDARTADHDLATAGHAGNVSKERERSIAMADLVVIAFPTEAKAEEIRGKLLDMQKDYLIELSDAVIAVKQPNGGVKLNQLFHPTATGAVSGTFWGTLIGLIFLMPLAGAAIGAAAGALSGALTDVGINDQFMKDVSQSLQSGNAALFLLIRKVTADKVLAGLQGVGGTVLRTSLDHTKEEALQRALAGAVAAQPAAAPVSTPTTAG